MDGRRLTIHVDGVPVPQGSMRAYVVGGHPVVTHMKAASLGAWRQSIAARADEAMAAAGFERLTGAVSIELYFGLRRPRSHYGARGTVTPRYADACPSVAPDIDKLVRAALDALTGIVFADDGQVVELVARKAYAERPGLDITIEGCEQGDAGLGSDGLKPLRRL